jgi:hypothetical protein
MQFSRARVRLRNHYSNSGVNQSMISLSLAVWIVRLTLLYLLIGLCFAVVFAARGAGRLDPVARHGTIGFRLLVIPGAMTLWPYLAWRVAKGVPSRERNAHRDLAR